MLKNFIQLFAISVLCCISTSAAVKPNNLFCDYAVFQRGVEVPVWGFAKEAEKITVQFDGQKITTVAKDGKWMVRLKPMKENSTPQDLLIKGENTVTIKNVLIGEVWLCSGQSNMEWALSRSSGGVEAATNSANSNLRIFSIPYTESVIPNDTVRGQWKPSSPTTTKQMSAVGYWFASKLQKELGVPVGIIIAAKGGTTIQAWMSKPSIDTFSVIDKYSNYDSAKVVYEKDLKKIMIEKDKWEKARDSAKVHNLSIPQQPRNAMITPMRGPTMIYNGEINPLIPFAVRGVAWYQGENNCYPNLAKQYIELLPAFISGWRKAWGKPELPFIIFQLASWGKPKLDPNEKSWIALVQEAQLKTYLKTPNTALIITQDVADSNSVHYTNKEPIGERAKNAALSLVYNKPRIYLGPIFKSMKVEGNRAIIEFYNASNGLVVKGDQLNGFAVSGNDKKFVFATAKIEKNKVIITSDKISQIIAVRYGWADFPIVNLYNKEGIPASPFRTDNF